MVKRITDDVEGIVRDVSGDPGNARVILLIEGERKHIFRDFSDLEDNMNEANTNGIETGRHEVGFPYKSPEGRGLTGLMEMSALKKALIGNRVRYEFRAKEGRLSHEFTGERENYSLRILEGELSGQVVTESFSSHEYDPV